MNRSAIRALFLATAAAVSACGEAPPGDFPQAGDPGSSPNLQRIPFTGVVEPASGRIQIIMHSQAVGVIPTDKDGNATTVAANTAQVYGANVLFASGGVGYPAACNAGAPQVMYSNVEVFSGFKEQVRTVYARLTTVSGGQTFCGKATPPAAYANILDPNVGLYLYQPLDPGTNANSALKRSVQWALNLPDNGAFSFSGDLYAEVIPQPPTNVTPTDGNVFHVATPTTSARVTFAWTNDPLADGSNTEVFLVARPANRGGRVVVYRCGTGAVPDPVCSATPFWTRATTLTSLLRTRSLTPGWYRWTLEAGFTLPPSTTQVFGRTTARYFQVVTP